MEYGSAEESWPRGLNTYPAADQKARAEGNLPEYTSSSEEESFDNIEHAEAEGLVGEEKKYTKDPFLELLEFPEDDPDYVEIDKPGNWDLTSGYIASQKRKLPEDTLPESDRTRKRVKEEMDADVEMMGL